MQLYREKCINNIITSRKTRLHFSLNVFKTRSSRTIKSHSRLGKRAAPRLNPFAEHLLTAPSRFRAHHPRASLFTLYMYTRILAYINVGLTLFSFLSLPVSFRRVPSPRQCFHYHGFPDSKTRTHTQSYPTHTLRYIRTLISEINLPFSPRPYRDKLVSCDKSFCRPTAAVASCTVVVVGVETIKINYSKSTIMGTTFRPMRIFHVILRLYLTF